MGTTLTGTTPATTYDSLIKVTDNGPLSATAKYLSDGLGNDSALALSTARVGVGTNSPNAPLDVRGSLGVRIDEAGTSANILTLRSDFAGAGPAVNVTTSSPLLLMTANTERMRITSAGNVGIGATPTAWSSGFRVLEGSYFTSSAYDQNVPNYIISSNTYNDGAWKYGINAPATRYSNIGWVGAHVFDVAVSGTAGTAVAWNERVRIDADGLKFNGDTAAANALDDYEEGTWTMGVAFGGASVGVILGYNTGTYTKIGRQVTVNGYLTLTSKGSSTGIAQITGLPFTIGNSTANYSVPSLWLDDITFANVYSGYGLVNDTKLDLFEFTEAGVFSSLTNADFADTSRIMISFTYFV